MVILSGGPTLQSPSLTLPHPGLPSLRESLLDSPWRLSLSHPVAVLSGGARYEHIHSAVLRILPDEPVRTQHHEFLYRTSLPGHLPGRYPPHLQSQIFALLESSGWVDLILPLFLLFSLLSPSFFASITALGLKLIPVGEEKLHDRCSSEYPRSSH